MILNAPQAVFARKLRPGEEGPGRAAEVLSFCSSRPGKGEEVLKFGGVPALRPLPVFPPIGGRSKAVLLGRPSVQ